MNHRNRRTFFFVDSSPKSESPIDHFGSLQNIFNAPVEELEDIDGIHEALARYISDFIRRKA